MSWHKQPEEQRRAQIIAAALRVAARDGLAKLTLRAVATEAGMSHGSVLFHYGTKDTLLIALLDDLLNWLGRPSPADGDPTFAAVLLAEITHTDRDRTAVLLDFWVLGTRTPHLHDRMRAAITAYEQRLTDLAPTTGDLPPHHLAHLATIIIFGTALCALLDDNPTPPTAALQRLWNADPAPTAGGRG